MSIRTRVSGWLDSLRWRRYDRHVARDDWARNWRWKLTRSARWLRLRLTGNRQRIRNWLNRRALRRGRAPLPGRITRAAGSRTPVYRNRVNPATGRPRRDGRLVSRPVRDTCPSRRSGRSR